MMAGLLNLTDDPQTLGLLSLGLRLMSTPGKFGTALGQSGLGAMDDVLRQTQLLKEQKRRDEEMKIRAEQAQRMQAEFEAEQQQRRAQQQQAQARDAYLASLSGQMGPPEPVNVPNALRSGLGAQELSMLLPKPRDSMIGKVDPKDYTPESLRAFLASGDPSMLRAAPKEQKMDELIIMGPDGKPMINPLVLQARKDIAAAGKSDVSVSYGAPVPGVDAQGNPVFFQPSKGGGQPAIIPSVRPADVVAKQEAKELDKAKAAQVAEKAHKTLTQMLSHPGLDTAVGLSGQIDPRNYIWGTEAKGAQSLIEQAQGQAFLQAFESLKGGGQITQIEGEKATAAIARLQRSQGGEDFKSAVRELIDIASKAHERATGKPLSQSVPKIGGPYTDAEKERRYQEWKRQQGQP